MVETQNRKKIREGIWHKHSKLQQVGGWEADPAWEQKQLRRQVHGAQRRAVGQATLGIKICQKRQAHPVKGSGPGPQKPQEGSISD